jgi:hypothetical protein
MPEFIRTYEEKDMDMYFFFSGFELDQGNSCAPASRQGNRGISRSRTFAKLIIRLLVPTTQVQELASARELWRVSLSETCIAHMTIEKSWPDLKHMFGFVQQ